MSVLAVSDLVFGDLLTELKIKPWWEKIRGYCFAASVVCALFMTYSMLSSTSINCFPIVAGNTTQTTIPTTEAHFINNYCFNQLPLYISLFGFSPLCFSIAIMLASSYWTLLPDVINSFRTFAQFEEIIGKLNLTAEQLCAMSSEIVNSSSSDECKQLRKACSLLWKYKSRINVEDRYWIRNLILTFVTIIFSASSVTMLHSMLEDKSNFKCFVKLDDEFNETIKVIKQQLCSHNKIKNLELFMIPFTISLLAQGVFTAVGISNFKLNPKRSLVISKGIKPEAEYSFFMIKFWKNSKPTSSGALEQLVHHMFGEGIRDMKPHLLKAISEDVEMFRLYCYYSGEKHAFWTIDKEIKKKAFTVESTQHAKIVQCIKYLKPELQPQEFEAFIKYLCEKKFWELLANVSVQYPEDWVRGLIGPPQLEINPNEIGQPYNLGRSFLYYFDKVASSDAVRTVLIPSFKNEFVHFDGKSVKLLTGPTKVRDYYMDHINAGGTLTDYAGNSGILIYVDGKAGILTLTKGKSSQKTIRELCRDHEKTTKNFKAKFNNSDIQTKEEIRSKYKEYLENLSEKLSRYKFKKWDGITKGLAKFANDEKQWVLLVALLNAYIVIYTECLGLKHPFIIHSCDVNEFTLNSKEEENISPSASILYYTKKLEHPSSIPCRAKKFLSSSEETQNLLPNESILYYALTKPPYLKNFLFTAIRHILGCTLGQEKNVRKDDGTIVSAIDFVKENPNLEFGERQNLIEILESDKRWSFCERSQSSSWDATSQVSSVTSGAGKSQAPAVTSITGKSQNPTVTSIAGKSQDPTVTSIAGPSQASTVTFQTGTQPALAETSVAETPQTPDKSSITIDFPYADEDEPHEDEPLLHHQTSRV